MMTRFICLAWLLGCLPCLQGCGRPGGTPPPVHPSSVATQPLLIPQFTDTAARAGIHFQHHNFASGHFYYPEIVGPGCALFDYDNDGWLDVYLVQGGPLPARTAKTTATNMLYHNNHDGTFSDVTQKAGVTGIIQGQKTYGIGCAVGDFDNDGYDDLLVTNFGSCILYHNNGNGTFTDVTAQAGLKKQGFWTSAAFFDYNNDGYLDLFICQYIKYHLGEDVACGVASRHQDYCPPGYFPPSQSALYRNNGNGTFTDVTRSAGILSNYNKALGVVATDLDGDGWPDLYVTCDLTPNLLYHNQGNGTFKEVAIERGVAFNDQGQPYASMGVDARDYDNDLHPDIIVTNYWLEGANLYHNLDGHLFADVSQGAGVGPPTLKHVGWGTGLRDFNNDTWLDCFIANGHVQLFPAQTTPGAEVKQTAQLLLNTGDGKFRDASGQVGAWFQEKRMARGAAFGDIDNDGDIDILTANNNDKPALLINQNGNRNHWLELKLVGQKSNRDGIGAKVLVTVNGKTFYDEVHSAYSFASANDLRAHFGLGAAAYADAIKIIWPSHQVDTLQHVQANQILRVTEGRGTR